MPDKQEKAALPKFELPPEIINGIVEKIIQMLIQMIMDKLKPSVPLPSPPVIDLPPQPLPSPGPPTDPARPQEAFLQAGITNCYHNWFKGDPGQNVPEGQATAHEVELIRQGLRGLPPGSNIQISADPMPHGCIEYPFPAVHVTLKDEVTGEEKTSVLTKEKPQPEGGDFWIQGGETPTSIYMRSNGHHFILLCPEPANRSSLRIELVASNGARSNIFGAPYFIRGDNRSRAALSAREPFVEVNEQDYQEKTIL